MGQLKPMLKLEPVDIAPQVDHFLFYLPFVLYLIPPN